jgi:hypothetical protein
MARFEQDTIVDPLNDDPEEDDPEEEEVDVPEVDKEPQSRRRVALKFPGRRGAELAVAHLGVFKNGRTSSVTEAQVKVWEVQTGRKWPADGLLALPEPARELTEEEQA